MVYISSDSSQSKAPRVPVCIFHASVAMPDGRLQVEENHAHAIPSPYSAICSIWEFLDDDQLRLLPETDNEDTIMLNFC